MRLCFWHMAFTRSSFYLWTLTLPWRTLIYDSANRCLAQHCGNKTATALPKNKMINQGMVKCLGSWHPSASALSALESTDLENLLFEQRLQTLHGCDMIVKDFKTWRNKKCLKFPLKLISSWRANTKVSILVGMQAGKNWSIHSLHQVCFPHSHLSQVLWWNDIILGFLASRNHRGRRRKFCGVVTWSEIGHNPNKFDLKNLKKETNSTSPREWCPDLPNCFPYTWIYIVWNIFRTTGALKKTNATIQWFCLPVSINRLTVLRCQNFAPGTMLIFEVSLYACKLRCLISDPERSATFDLWSSCFKTNFWVNY